MYKLVPPWLRYAFLFFSPPLVAQNDPVILWEENFEGAALNELYWNIALGNGCPENCGWGNNERQYYTKDNYRIEDGLLFITAQKDGSTYTSSKITTKDKFQFRYGKIEIRAKLPSGHGVWPAFWLLGANIDTVGWPLCGEIDIMEYVGKEPEMLMNAIHTQASYGNTVNTKKTLISGIDEGFHIFSALWTPDRIDFFVDDVLRYSFSPPTKTEQTWPFDKPFYVILNMAIGGNLGGPQVDDTIFPQDFVIDYVRIFKNP
ncbi:glycoside hydrolase family 16 protein [Arenibacter sp. GZD96]|nr:glycoside hydrolase family 16 protein [Arenibacter sp. GZD-96]